MGRRVGCTRHIMFAFVSARRDEWIGWGFSLTPALSLMERGVRAAKYSSVCRRKLCYTECVIHNWISVAPLGRRPFYRAGGHFISGYAGYVPFRVERRNTMDVRIYVGNLAKSTTQDEINTLFAQAGTVTSVDLVKDKGTGMSKGFAFVSMPTQADADKAISMFNDYAMAENKLKVNIAKPRVG